MVRPGGDPPTRRSSWIAPREGVIGHAIAGRMRTGLVTEASAMAVRNCPPIRGVTVLHSDRGAQYTSAGCTGFMTDRGILPSVGRTGSRYDNAAAESFNAVSREELVNRKVHSTRNHAIRDVTARIESRYNHKRLHSAIDHQTPDQADTEWRQQHKAAARNHPSTTTRKTHITPNPDPPPALDTDRPVSQSTTQNQWAQDRVDHLRQQNVRDLRVNQQQVNAQGQRVGINRPDLQYTGKDGGAGLRGGRHVLVDEGPRPCGPYPGE